MVRQRPVRDVAEYKLKNSRRCDTTYSMAWESDVTSLSMESQAGLGPSFTCAAPKSCGVFGGILITADSSNELMHFRLSLQHGEKW